MPGQRIVSKLTLSGDFGVGKTSIRRNYMGEHFIADHLSTLGADFAVKRVDIDEDIVLELQIWDLAGQPGFENLRQRFFKGAAAAFMVFDLTRRETFDNLDIWFEQLWRSQKNKRMPYAILGNKHDLNNSAVEESEIQEYMDRLRNENNLGDSYISYFTTSAITGENIQTVFNEISMALFDKLKED